MAAFYASPDYFRAMGISLVRGRLFTIADARSGVGEGCIVNQALAELAWPGQDPLGKKIRGIEDDSPGQMRTVIGIVADVRYQTLERVSPAIYVPLDAHVPPAVLAIRTTGSPRLALNAVKQVLAGIDQGYAIREAVTMPELISVQLAKPRLLSAVLSTLSAGAIALAGLGAFSVLALMVALRSHEFGVRRALGATSRNVRALVMREGLRLMGLGVLIGLGIAIAGTRVLRSQLYAVTPTDPFTMTVAVAFLFVVAIAAYYIPARRAGDADPAQALRQER